MCEQGVAGAGSWAKRAVGKRYVVSGRPCLGRWPRADLPRVGHSYVGKVGAETILHLITHRRREGRTIQSATIVGDRAVRSRPVLPIKAVIHGTPTPGCCIPLEDRSAVSLPHQRHRAVNACKPIRYRRQMNTGSGSGSGPYFGLLREFCDPSRLVIWPGRDRSCLCRGFPRGLRLMRGMSRSGKAAARLRELATRLRYDAVVCQDHLVRQPHFAS